VSKEGVATTWWSDCYGECPRMFYQAFAGIPEFAPPHENHILYSEGVLTKVQYGDKKITYTATDREGIEYMRLAFNPDKITVNGKEISKRSDLNGEGYILKDIGNGDYSLNIKRMQAGIVIASK